MEKYAPAELILRFFVEAQEARQFPTVSLSTEVMQIAASLGARGMWTWNAIAAKKTICSCLIQY